jgi:hypothetical protein
VRHPSAGITAVVLGDEDALVGMGQVQANNEVDDPAEAPSVEHPGVLVHVDSGIC